MVVDVSPTPESVTTETPRDSAAERITSDCWRGAMAAGSRRPRANSIRHAFHDAIWGMLDPEGSLYSPEITGDHLRPAAVMS